VDTLNWNRRDLDGATRQEFTREDVRTRLERHIPIVESMIPSVPARFVEDLRHAGEALKSAREKIAYWESCRAEAEAQHQQAAERTASSEVTSLADLFGEPVHVVTRAQLIEEGELLDVSAIGSEAGFRIPVAMSRAAWSDCVAWAETDSMRQTYQDEAGRLWDVLWMAYMAARRNRGSGAVRFQLYRIPRGGVAHVPAPVTLKMLCGPGDQGEPVITILEVTED